MLLFAFLSILWDDVGMDIWASWVGLEKIVLTDKGSYMKEEKL